MRENCPCPNNGCSIKGDCLECVITHSEKGFIPYCIYVNNGNKVYNNDCKCKTVECVRYGKCEECVKFHGEISSLPCCLRC